MSRVGKGARRQSQSKSITAINGLYGNNTASNSNKKQVRKLVNAVKKDGGLFYKGEPRIVAIHRI